jgi:hypothetical protein
MRENENAYKILVGKPEEKRPFIRHRHRYEDNIKKGKKVKLSLCLTN